LGEGRACLGPGIAAIRGVLAVAVGLARGADGLRTRRWVGGDCIWRDRRGFWVRDVDGEGQRRRRRGGQRR
jgi:hypothetical protein